MNNNNDKTINKSNKPPLVIITGPTAAGKTDLSIFLAKELDGEIISADSMQVYQTMDIGTAKIKPEEMQGVRHHLIDVFPPEHGMNVAEFKELAKAAIEDITSRGKLPIIVGGTGFYIQAVLYDIDFTAEEDNTYRDELSALGETEEGRQKLYEMLKTEDPKAAEEIHPNNVRRVIRALEFKRNTGKPISEHNAQERAKESPYDFMYFVINMNRDTLYKRIDKRVDIMLKEGLIDEVHGLLSRGLNEEHVSMQGIGYKEICQYLRGELTKEESIELLKQNTRHFAKRQLTWFRRERDVIWVDKDSFDSEDAFRTDILNRIKDHNN